MSRNHGMSTTVLITGAMGHGLSRGADEVANYHHLPSSHPHFAFRWEWMDSLTLLLQPALRKKLIHKV